ncbi:LacI family transcriptional regulator [Clostridia bacterium]|nr:LacI family transcriptional regulator [Clostridia bacterium]
MANRTDVAKLAGVSVATVSNVFARKNIVAPSKIDKVYEAARQLRYTPNYRAQCLSLGRSMNIGVLIDECTNPYHLEIVSGIEKYAGKKKYSVSVFILSGNTGTKLSFVESRQLDALVNMTTCMYPSTFIENCKNTNTVLVDFGADFGAGTFKHFTAAMLQLMERTASLGHTKVGYVSTSHKESFSCDERGICFLQNRRAMGFCEDADLIINSEELYGFSEDTGYRLAKELLERRPDITAIFATNDLAAIGVIRVVAEKGLNVPRDISVIGCDDLNISKRLTPSLTTMAYDKQGFGAEIARSVIELIEGKRNGVGVELHATVEPIFRESLTKCRS